MDLVTVWGRHRAGEHSAREQLIEAYGPLAMRIAQGMHVPTGVLAGRDDLESAAHVGLIQAIDRYDPGRGVPFEPYAALRIRGAILDELRLVDDVSRGERARLDHEGTSGRQTVSLDRLLAGGHSWEADAGLDDRYEAEDLRGRVEGAVHGLPDRQRELIGRYYGESLTLREAGRRMGISEARACQLHGRAIENLRRALTPVTASAA